MKHKLEKFFGLGIIVFSIVVGGINVFYIVFRSSEVTISSVTHYSPEDLRVVQAKIKDIPKDAIAALRSFPKQGLISRLLHLSRDKPSILHRIGRAFVLVSIFDRSIFVFGEINYKSAKLIKDKWGSAFIKIYVEPIYLELFKQIGLKSAQEEIFEAQNLLKSVNIYKIAKLTREVLRQSPAFYRVTKLYKNEDDFFNHGEGYGLFVDGKLVSVSFLIFGTKQEDKLLKLNGVAELVLEIQNLSLSQEAKTAFLKYMIDSAHDKGLNLFLSSEAKNPDIFHEVYAQAGLAKVGTFEVLSKHVL